MSNPLSQFGVSDLDYALSVGILMGEENDLVGMGLVAASGLNRSDRPSAFLSKSARLGDIFSAPHSAENMAAHVLSGKALPRERGPRQYSATINKNIPGATKAAFANFAAGVRAALDKTINPDAQVPSTYQTLFGKAQTALAIAVKADALGIDLGFGITNYGGEQKGKDFSGRAGVGRNTAQFGNHTLGPFAPGVTPPTEAEFTARFAAAAALVGHTLTGAEMDDVLSKTTPGEISTAASVLPIQSALATAARAEPPVAPSRTPNPALDGFDPALAMVSQLQQEGLAFHGLTYGINGVQRMPFEAVNIPDLTGRLGITPVGALGFGRAPDWGELDFDLTGRNTYRGRGPMEPFVTQPLPLEPISLPGSIIDGPYPDVPTFPSGYSPPTHAPALPTNPAPAGFSFDAATFAERFGDMPARASFSERIGDFPERASFDERFGTVGGRDFTTRQPGRAGAQGGSFAEFVNPAPAARGIDSVDIGIAPIFGAEPGFGQFSDFGREPERVSDRPARKLLGRARSVRRGHRRRESSEPARQSDRRAIGRGDSPRHDAEHLGRCADLRQPLQPAGRASAERA